MPHRNSHRQRRSGFIACMMGYVLAVQVTLALLLNAGLPVSRAEATAAICHVLAPTGQADAPAAAPTAHCPLCVSPAFALLTPPDAPHVAQRLTPGIAFKPLSLDAVAIAAPHRAHRARAPPVNV